MASEILQTGKKSNILDFPSVPSKGTRAFNTGISVTVGKAATVESEGALVAKGCGFLKICGHAS